MEHCTPLSSNWVGEAPAPSRRGDLVVEEGCLKDTVAVVVGVDAVVGVVVLITLGVAMEEDAAFIRDVVVADEDVRIEPVDWGVAPPPPVVGVEGI